MKLGATSVRRLWLLCGAVTLGGAVLPLLGFPFLVGLAVVTVGAVGTITFKRIAVSLGVSLDLPGGGTGAGGDGGGDGGGGGK